MARFFKRLALAITAVCLVAAGYYAYSFYHFAQGIHQTAHESKFFPNTGKLQASSTKKGDNISVPPKWEGKERVNILLLGGDSRGLAAGEVPRSDSMMVASIDPVTKKAALFSILRDTYVKIPGHGEERINSAISLGGPELAMQTVGDLLGIPIQYYVYTDFKGFIALVDAIGGIDIDVEKDMKYSDAEDDHLYDIDLKKGPQHLDGKTALEYVRFRHDAMSDFARTERQRKFLQAVAEKMQSTWSIVKLPKILSAVDPYIETNLGVTDMLKLASLGYDAKANEVAKAQLPPMDLLEEKTVHGAEVIGVDPKKLQAFVQKQFSGGDDGTSEPGRPASAVAPAGVSPGSRTALGVD